MNYQHAFHAGNFADVHKHAVLARILLQLRAKPAAFRVIDTHAGGGRYDLLGAEPSRSGEWRQGIERVWNATRPGALQTLLAPYLDVVAALNPDGRLRTYPGSPVIAKALLRAQDRLIACELEPRAAASLKAALRGDQRVKVLSIDGWTALNAFVPPKERRGLVIVDPPFEDADDFLRLSNVVEAAHRKWPTGIYTLWYPIKAREASDALAKRLKKLGGAKILRSEIALRPLRADSGLIGSGLIVINPPFRLDEELGSLVRELGQLLSPSASHRLDWLVQQP